MVRCRKVTILSDVFGRSRRCLVTNETEGRQPGDPVDEREEQDDTTGGMGSGRTLFGRSFGRQRGANPELTSAERRRRLAYAGGGVLAAIITVGGAVLGVRRWRRRG
jgi:hypothetical protein